MSRLSTIIVTGVALGLGGISLAAEQSSPVLPGGVPMRIDALGADRSRVVVAADDGTRVTIETRDVYVIPAPLGFIFHFGAGKAVSTWVPPQERSFPCLSQTLSTDAGTLSNSIKDLAANLGKGRFDFGVQLSCQFRAEAGIPDRPADTLPDKVLIRIDAIDVDQSRALFAGTNGVRLSIDTRDIHVTVSQDAFTFHFGPGKARSSLTPALEKSFPCLAVAVPNDYGSASAWIGTVGADISRARWDFAVSKSCTWRANLGIR